VFNGGRFDKRGSSSFSERARCRLIGTCGSGDKLIPAALSAADGGNLTETLTALSRPAVPAVSANEFLISSSSACLDETYDASRWSVVGSRVIDR